MNLAMLFGVNDRFFFCLTLCILIMFSTMIFQSLLVITQDRICFTVAL